MKGRACKILSLTLTICLLLSTVPFVGASALSSYDFVKDGIAYQENGESVTVVASSHGYSGNLEIPANVTYDDTTYAVTAIDKHAFAASSGLTGVTIPETVTKIGDGAFTYCTALTGINVDENNPSYSSADGVLFEFSKENDKALVRYPAAKTNSQYTIPDGVKTIGDMAFGGNPHLVNLTIPDSVTEIAAMAFLSHEDQGSQFNDCDHLKQINVAEGNSAYSSEDGVLFLNSGADGKILILYPPAKGISQYTLPDNVSSVYTGAFISCDGLTSVAFPENFESLNEAAFVECTDLSGLTFTGDCVAVNGNPFYDCTYPIAVTVPEAKKDDYKEAFSKANGIDGEISINGHILGSVVSTLGGRGGSGTDTSVADPLKIEVLSNGRVGLYYRQQLEGSSSYGYQCQYFDRRDWGTNLFYTKDGQQYLAESDYYTEEGCKAPDGCEVSELGDGDQEKSGNTVTTTWQLDGGGLTLKQEVTYIPGMMYYEKKWTVTNNSGADDSDIRLTHGGDTYFGGDDEARSYWNPQTKMVYVVNKDMSATGFLGFSGSNISPADQYFSGDFWTGDQQASLGDLQNDAQSDYQDAGYQLQWNKDVLASNGTWTVDSYERISGPGLVQVISPSEQTAAPGSTVTYEFTVQNFSGDSQTYDLGAKSKNGWKTTVTEGDHITVEPDGGCQTVHVNVHIPDSAANAAADTITLTASDGSTSNSASTRAIVNSSLPTITAVASGSMISASASSMAVNVHTANVKSGTPITVSLLNEDKKPLDPPVSFTGTTSRNNTSIQLPLPGDLEEGTYHISVSVDGVAAVHDSTTITASEDVTTCAVHFSTDGGSKVADLTDAVVGGRIAEPADPSKGGCLFGGWYSDENLKKPWDFESDTVSEEMTLYAKWSLPQLAAPTGLSWSGTTAKWSKVTGPSGYTATLYKDGVSVATGTIASADTTSYSFANVLSRNGAGTYTFTVAAVGDHKVYDDSDTSEESEKYAYQGSSPKSNDHDSDGSSTTAATEPARTEIRVDSGSNSSSVDTVADQVTQSGTTSQISVTVPTVASDTTGSSATLNTSQQASVKIGLPDHTMIQQLASKKNVELTITVPSDVAHDSNPNVSLNMKASKEILEAAKENQADVTINVKDADTQQLAYTWTFKGSDLAKSDTPVSDINIAMSIHLTTEVPQVQEITPDRTGIVLSFDHSGVLPSTASLTFSAEEKGFKPGQKLYFYFYNAAAGQLESQAQEYTVDANGNVTVKISHCSSYVLLPNKARTITLDTRVYTMPVGSSYITGVKLTGVSGARLRAYSSTKGVADVTVLSNGNVKAKALKTGITYVMIDVYDDQGKFLTHASVRLIVENNGKPKGNSARQYGIF